MTVQEGVAVPGVRWRRRVADGARGSLWLAEGPNGRLVAVKEVRVSRPLARAHLGRAVQRLIDGNPEGMAPVLAVHHEKESMWIVREWVDGVSAGALAEVAPPRAVAAAQLARGVLRALVSVHDLGLVHGGVHIGNVFIDRDGCIWVSDAGIAPEVGRRGRTSAQQDLAAVAVMLREVWRPMRGATSPPLAGLITSGALQHAPSARDALRLIEECLPDNPAEADTLAPRARELLPEPGHEADELLGSGEKGQEQPGAPVLSPAAPRMPVRRVLTGGAVLVAVLAATLGVTRPWNHPSLARAPVVLPATSAPVVSTPGPVTFAPVTIPTPLPTPGPSPTPHPFGTFVLQPPAPPSDGVIADAEWSSGNGPCPLGFPCDIYSWLDLSAHPPLTVRWEMVAVDQCTGAQTVLYNVSQPAASTATVVSDSRTITLPGGDPLVLYTVADVPARVASPPLMITPSDGRCAE